MATSTAPLGIVTERQRTANPSLTIVTPFDRIDWKQSAVKVTVLPAPRLSWWRRLLAWVMGTTKCP